MAPILSKLRRERGNQWFSAIRGLIAPAALLQQDVADFGAEIAQLAHQLAKRALVLVAERGGELIKQIALMIGQRLVEAHVLAIVEDVYWLEWTEVIESLQQPSERLALIAQRKRSVGADFSVTMPDTIGPLLVADAPRMYLLREILRLLDS
jgi:hypothetical protein